ncbi:hypothetical protein K488DRAFT_74251 [Vararia minispora EC-137]|uniref:Uncharacterized protein n=1 Tax=Vararia minispora EC-137 TaxID=1314806 RepID=A0ACB8Q7P5_9AGAM|nr:hypothetical protein K488DRAFT_74251 [Vararia minispora EC-137]
MKFSTSLFIAAAVAAATSASALPTKRQNSGCQEATSILGNPNYDSPWTSPLVTHCINSLGNHAGYVNPWANRICVAAAISASPGILRNALSCRASDVPVQADLPNMPFSVYESITGSTSDKVFITQQNLIDLVYSSIQLENESGTPVWPISAEDVIGYITLIFDWTATGSTIPYYFDGGSRTRRRSRTTWKMLLCSPLPSLIRAIRAELIVWR